MQVQPRGSDYQEIRQLTTSVSPPESRPSAVDVTASHSLAALSNSATSETTRQQAIFPWASPERSASAEAKFAAENATKQNQTPPGMLPSSLGQSGRVLQQSNMSSSYEYPLYTYPTHYPQQTVYRYPATFTPTYQMGGSLYAPGTRAAILQDVTQPHLAKDIMLGSVPPAVHPVEEKRYILNEPPPAYNFSEPYGSGYSAQDPGYSDYYGYQSNITGVIYHVLYPVCQR